MKRFLIMLFAAIAGVFTLMSMKGRSREMVLDTPFHGFKVLNIDGDTFDLASLKGKKVMVVNVASNCGLTPQYEALQDLYDKYHEQGFEIVGFPANNFLGQEPGTDEEIKSFCSTKFGVTFPMMSKISVKGEDMHPLYHWLTEKVNNGVYDSEVKWNFQKFLIDEEGNLVGIAWPKEKPNAEKVINWLEKGTAPGF